MMSFGEAIESMKKGYRVSRSGWNGKGMYIYIMPGNERYEPCIWMHTAQNREQPGWLASQPDMLSNDWTVVNE